VSPVAHLDAALMIAAIFLAFGAMMVGEFGRYRAALATGAACAVCVIASVLVYTP
jgi:hypothetical protein